MGFIQLYLPESFRFEISDSDIGNILDDREKLDQSAEEPSRQVTPIFPLKKLDNVFKDNPSSLGPNDHILGLIRP